MFGVLFGVDFVQYKNSCSLTRKRLAQIEFRFPFRMPRLWQTKAMFSESLLQFGP